jgi:hypothetical protein
VSVPSCKERKENVENLEIRKLENYFGKRKDWNEFLFF